MVAIDLGEPTIYTESNLGEMLLQKGSYISQAASTLKASINHHSSFMLGFGLVGWLSIPSLSIAWHCIRYVYSHNLINTSGRLKHSMVYFKDFLTIQLFFLKRI